MINTTPPSGIEMDLQNRISHLLRAKPELRLAKTYHDAEHGGTWRVITEWWPAGSPEAEGGDPDPLNPGLVVTQRCVRSGDDLWDEATFYPVSGLSAD